MDVGRGTTTSIRDVKRDSLQLYSTPTSRFLQEYDFDVVHRAGAENTNADCLSRYPLESTGAAPILDWTKGEILPLATYFALMADLVDESGVIEVDKEKDIWSDIDVPQFLQTHKYCSGSSAMERDRIYRRAKGYRWQGSSVFKMMQHGALVVVLRPQDRQDLVIHTHRTMGHFGVQRTVDRLKKDYWWRGMGDIVVEIIKACLPCARVKAGFSEPGKELQPLPVRGLGYRWGVDFAGLLEETSAGNSWVMVCIEHFTKWVELVPLPSKSSKDSARGLLENVLARYGAPGEILTHQGSEF